MCHFISRIPNRVFFQYELIEMSLEIEFALNELNSALALKKPKMKIAKFANCVDPDEVAHYEPPHLDLHCLPSIVFEFPVCYSLDKNILHM